MSYFDGAQDDKTTRRRCISFGFSWRFFPSAHLAADLPPSASPSRERTADLAGEDLNFVHKHEAAPQKELERLQKMLTSGSFNVELLGPSVQMELHGQRFSVVLLAGGAGFIPWQSRSRPLEAELEEGPELGEEGPRILRNHFLPWNQNDCVFPSFSFFFLP